MRSALLKYLGAFGLLFLGVAVPGHAEVRLHVRGSEGALALGVHATRSGPWSPVGASDDLTLNPQGDIVGDGFPSHRADGDQLMVAWLSPSQGGLAVALGSSRGWQRTVTIPAEGAVGHPMPLNLNGRAAVMWRQGEDARELRLAFVSNEGSAEDESLWLADLSLSAWRTTADGLQLIGFDDRARLVIEELVLGVVLPDDPIIIERSSTVLGEIATVGAEAGHPGGWRFSPSVRSEELELRSGGSVGLLTWWSTPGELSFIALDDAGPMLPVERLQHPGKAERPQSLIREAERVIRERHR